MARFTAPIVQMVNDDASGVAAGWLLHFYDTETTTRKDTFSDNDLTTANTNPVVADSAGRFGNIFLESGTYKVVLTDADDVEKWTADPVDGATGSAGSVRDVTADTTLTVDDSSKVINVDASSAPVTVTLLAAATAGNGFGVTVKKIDNSANAVTVDGNGAETIDGAASVDLNVQYHGVELRCDGSNWFITNRYKNINIDADAENAVASSLAFTSKIFAISSGAITPTRINVVLAAESGTSDTLDTMGTGSVSDGAIVILSADSGDTITINDAQGSAGEMHLVDSQDLVLSGNDRLALIRDGADWYELWRAVDNQQVVQVIETVTTAHDTGTTNMVLDDTIPQNTEGNEYSALNTTITPTDATNRLVIEIIAHVSRATSGFVIGGLFQDSTADALSAAIVNTDNTAQTFSLIIRHEMAAGTTSSTTFKFRAGGSGGDTVAINGTNSARLLGGAIESTMRITEYRT